MCDLFAMLQQRYEDFSSEILILSFCVYVSTLHIFLLCLFSYSGLILVCHPFCFIRTAIRAAGGFQATACQGRLLYSFIFVHIPYFYFSITGYFYFRRHLLLHNRHQHHHHLLPSAHRKSLQRSCGCVLVTVRVYAHAVWHSMLMYVRCVLMRVLMCVCVCVFWFVCVGLSGYVCVCLDARLCTLPPPPAPQPTTQPTRCADRQRLPRLCLCRSKGVGSL